MYQELSTKKGRVDKLLKKRDMEFIKQIERLQLLNKLVREKRTGNPRELAERLGLSRRQLYSYLEFLKDYGIDIVYSRKTNSFIFNNGKEIKIDFQFQVLDEKANREITGGKSLENFLPCCFSARSETKLAPWSVLEVNASYRSQKCCDEVI